ncbi:MULTISPECIES: translesion error-prone DNA polymerase V subunit UmuC [unclassified Pantoea]|uniref:translesion error-prone DNA polymerase V subunit UmuC n=1 Tax=unclassified Pantoea TaxID=2630326 RepID=UPI002477B1A7|nr:MULTISPECIES: translesion error-prone DNA polymerase V subunit UmuC [unclassified Pantoea]GME47174.1 translesion error-prone DNA polymerase V subunit UmuC [Pantoea sp. QMID3]GME47513.1 translesion error-prone DNA polymerase V subunit UmuC [Pantoea sp. QMID1]GME62165.1 translesion error-prone DNA polymerase V subunit UmuC [Pantoea sp. QMID4]GME63492.1 translesion error-prone DNA polymerase V subunit UmuC [Pantoea sp. QMID2]
MSARMMAILGEMAAGQEVYSIDESFLDVTGISDLISLETFGQQMRERIRRETGLIIGVGFGPTKTLAKLANYAAKKWTQTRGVVDLSSRVRQRKLLHLTDVADIWGIGPRITKRMHQLGITTALQLADSNISMIRKNFDVIVERTTRELNGESCIALEDAPPPKQHILNSRSFGERVIKLEDMQQAIVLYATRAAEKLREQNSRCRHISVSIATARHGDEPQYSNAASRICDYPTNDTRDIIESALSGLNTIWQEGYRYAKAGVMLGDFYQSGVAQFDMFSEQQPRANADALMAALDCINRSGKGKVFFAGQGDRDSSWQMKREMLSPRYTTRLKDIPSIK